MSRKTKRVVVIGDTHCGHRVGLTPPQWMLNEDNDNDAKWLGLQRAQWDWYVKTIRALRPIDLLLVMGDCVDGRGDRANGRDVIRPGRTDQVDMAEIAILEARAKKIEGVYGTRYHVTDWEEDLFNRLGSKAKIGAHGWPRVNGVTFDIKHKVGASGASEHTRHTAIMRAKLWNTIWAEAARQPNADILLRGHVHYCRGGFRVVGEKVVWAMTCPALQGIGTEYGAEQCEGLVDFGLMHFDITPTGNYTWTPHFAVLPEQIATVTDY